MTPIEEHDICSRLAEIGIVAGNRVRFTEDFENYPTVIVDAGETGEITLVSRGEVHVKLDFHHPELGEWDNEVHFYLDPIQYGDTYIEELKKLEVLS